MANEFHTLHDFMVHSKGVIYLLMGGILVGFVAFWRFLTGREEKMRKY